MKFIPSHVVKFSDVDVDDRGWVNLCPVRPVVCCPFMFHVDITVM